MPNRKSFKNDNEYREWYRSYREKNAQKLREYNRDYNRIWRMNFGYHNESNSKKRYPHKVRARDILHSAVKKGLLKKEPCQICKRLPSQAHHDDYNFPLSVKWFCAFHHKQIHR